MRSFCDEITKLRERGVCVCVCVCALCVYVCVCVCVHWIIHMYRWQLTQRQPRIQETPFYMSVCRYEYECVCVCVCVCMS